MKRVICVVLLAAMVLAAFSGCAAEPNRAVSCGEVVAAYEEAGYAVWHRDYPEKEYGYACCIEIEGEDGNHISFYFFETEEEAESYADQRQWNWAVWLVSLAMFQPTWLTTKTYQNIEIEYDSDQLYKPFAELLKG